MHSSESSEAPQVSYYLRLSRAHRRLSERFEAKAAGLEKVEKE